MKTRRINCQLTTATAALSVLGLAASAFAAAPNSQPVTDNQVLTPAQALSDLGSNTAVLLDSTITGFRARAAGPNCQEEVPNPTGGAGSRNYGPAFRLADNFRVASSGTLSSITWDAIYRSGTAAPFTNQAPPATETFTIRILTDNGPFPSPFPNGANAPTPGLPNGVTPLFSTTVTNPSRTATGGSVGTVTPLSVYEYTAAISGGPALNPGQCYWLEITNTSPDIATPNPAGMITFWVSGGGGGGVAGDLYAYQASNPPTNPANPYTPFNQIPQDQAFCLNLNLQSLISNPCDQTPIPPVCTNDAANGNGTASIGLAFTSGSAAPGSNGVSAASARTQRAENFQLSGTGSATLTSICFSGFYWNYLAVPNNPQPATPADLSRFRVTYFANSTTTGLPTTTILGDFTGAQLTVLNGGNLYGITHPAVTVTRGTCYHVAVSYRDDINDPNAFGRFAWDLIGLATETNGPPAVRDNRSSSRTITPDGNIATPPGAWAVTNGGTDGRFNLSFALSAGPAIRPVCVVAAPPNNSCATATPITVGTPVSSYNTSSGVVALPSCGFDLFEGPVAWHTFAGTGNDITFTMTQPGGQTSDLILSVFCATSCAGPFTCVGGNTGVNPGDAVAVTVSSALGLNYFVTVSGFQGAVGAYTIAATSGAASAPVTCATFARCQLEATVAASTEPEVCRTDAPGSLNFDCASATAYTLGTIGKGSVSTFLNTTAPAAQNRDIDFWQLPTFASPTTVDIFVNSEFPVLFQFLNYASSCTDTAAVVPNSTFVSAICVGPSTSIATVTIPSGGLNRLLITATSFDGLPCSSGDNTYTFRVAGFTPPSTGACCLGVGCTVTTAAACTGAVGTTTNNFKGTGTVCNAPGTAPFTNNITPCCRGDFTQDGTRAPADIFAFLNNYFSTVAANRLTADANGNGTNEPADIFAFLNIYFAGGC